MTPANNNGSIRVPLFLYATASSVFALDQLMKWYAHNRLPDTVTLNRGLSFSIPASPLVVAGLLTLAGLLCILIATKINVYKNTKTAFASGLFVGGAISNIFDRIHVGGVIDIFHVFISRFNAADIAIIIGLTILTTDIFRTTRRKHLP